MAVKSPLSIRARLIWGAALVLIAFLAGAGWAVQQAYVASVQAERFARLQTTVYLLLAGAELDDKGALVMPATLAEPRLSLPASGLYAHIANLGHREVWQSASTVGLELPFQTDQVAGQWRFEVVRTPSVMSGESAPNDKSFLAATYGVVWSVNQQAAPLVFSVLEDKTEFDRAARSFKRTLWLWLGGAGLLLLLTQTLLLHWALTPLRRMALEIQGIESGRQAKVDGRYPAELAGLTLSLNGLIDQERARQTRYKEALDDLAHSLKTPLAVLRATLDDPAEMAAQVAQQVDRMDDIVVHQLSRAGTSGAARFAPHLMLGPLLGRIRDSLAKVYVDKNLTFDIDCPAPLRWRIDQGDAFELLGNVLDNAAKWARHRVGVRVGEHANVLSICITDDGPGFAQAPSALARRVRLDETVPGHGIGLAVVRDLVASHQGTLTFSHAPEGGAQVDIVLRRIG